MCAIIGCYKISGCYDTTWTSHSPVLFSVYRASCADLSTHPFERQGQLFPDFSAVGCFAAKIVA